MPRRLLLSFASATMLLAPKLSSQTTVYTTFGPGDSYVCCPGFLVSGSSFVLGGYSWGAGFTYGGPSGDLLSAIRFAADNPSPSPLDILFLSGPTMGGATVLESWTVPSGSAALQIYSLTSLNHPSFTLGDIYWVLLRGGSSNAWWNWDANDQGITGLMAQSSDDGATWNQFPANHPAFDVTSISSSVVPEPATLTLLATGLAALTAMSLRRRKV